MKDLKIKTLIEKEFKRQKNTLEMIASENYTSLDVMKAQGSILTNKYAEGYPYKRYYGGCEFVDEIETLAIERSKKLFSAKFSNVQAHSGSQANMAAYLSILKTGDKILGMDLSQGGHLTHGSKVNFSGNIFKSYFYGVNPKTHLIDYDEIEKKALKIKPRLIICGFSAYPRKIDFKKFKQIAKKVNAYLLSDISHISGLVVAKSHPSPFPYSDIVTTTTHKTLRGPRGGIILTNSEDLSKKINSQIFPGIQGGPLEHVISAKAICFKEASTASFTKYIKQVCLNAKTLAKSLKKESFSLVTGGTDNHLILLDLSNHNITGKKAEHALEKAGIAVNKNTIPFDKRSPFVTSGIRLGTPALTSRSMKEKQMEEISFLISKVIKNHSNEKVLKAVKKEVYELCKNFPIY